jgi:hypothetical protein
LSSKVKNVQEEEYIVSKHRNQIVDGAAFHPQKLITSVKYMADRGT